MKIRIYLVMVLGLTSLTQGVGQKRPVSVDLFNLAKTHKLTVYDREAAAFSERDRKGVRFPESENDGVAWIEGFNFSNGTIEVDIKGRDLLQKSFLGVAFHLTEENTMDVVYFRPFNFRSTDSVRRIHAVQYVSPPGFTWQKLRAEQNGKYEKGIMPAPEPNQWFHARIVVHYPGVSVFVNGNQEASLKVDLLNNRTNGKIGLWVGPGSDGEFANLVITEE